MYLVAFNILSALGWTVVLLDTLHGLARPLGGDYIAANAFSTSLGASLLRYVPATYDLSWPVLAPVQTLASLEVLHVILGLVRSPLPTTFAQVSSRLVLVWTIVARFPSTHMSPIYTTMVLAWSLAEIPRYSYYAFRRPPAWLTWLRYSTFYVLYPLGAGSEALLALSTISEWQNGLYVNWALEDWTKAAMILIWIPGLYVMYTYMLRTRRKVLGPQKAQKLGATPKDRVKTK